MYYNRNDMSELAVLGSTPVNYSILESLYPGYKSPYSKIAALERAGRIIRLKKGMYVVAPRESGKLLSMELIANHLYGPSYISRETALRYYGLIPEAVYLTRSMTTKHSRSFENAIGHFEYTSCNADYFPIGIRQNTQGEISFLIASPEKALCDVICYTASLRLRFCKELYAYLEEDLRFDMDMLHSMNISIIERCAEVGKKTTTLNNLIKLIRK